MDRRRGRRYINNWPAGTHEKRTGGEMKGQKVKLYGLLPVSERTFLFVQGSFLALLLSAFVMVLWVPPDGESFRAAAEIGQATPGDDPASPQPSVSPFQAWVLRAFGYFADFAPWILIGLIAVGLLETLSILRKFREKARQR
jgi:hypothetical protein